MSFLGPEEETDETCVCVRSWTPYVCVYVYTFYRHVFGR